MKILSIILSLIILSCSTTKNTNSESNVKIAFGNGGGFTGIEAKYELKNDGTIYKIQMKDSSVDIIKKVDVNELKIIFNEAEILKDYKYFKPDNMYQFIEINNNRIVWGFDINVIDIRAAKLYNQLIALTK